MFKLSGCRSGNPTGPLRGHELGRARTRASAGGEGWVEKTRGELESWNTQGCGTLRGAGEDRQTDTHSRCWKQRRPQLDFPTAEDAA